MATKYVSSLTGSEMDSALLDMAYHNSEAYAVGTRNGVAVGSSDVTYHNNSKYWAEQVYGYTDRAEAAANRAESAVPSGTAGAVFFDRAQTLTSAQQAQARANIMAGGSNRNLLDNPWFTVRQRGDGPFSGANTIAMDRWRATSNSTITCTTNGITITTTVKKWGMQYRVTKDFFTVGKTYTISALEQDGTITNATFTWTGNGLSLYPTGSNVGFEVSTSNGSYDIIYFTTSEVGSVYLRAVKLELGSVSTLANDAPPDYQEELAKCKRYFRRITNIGRGRLFIGVGFSGGVEVPNIFGVGNEMRKTTSLTVTYSGSFAINAGTDIAVTNITKNENNSNFGLSFAASGITPYTLYSILGSAGAYIDISADL